MGRAFVDTAFFALTFALMGVVVFSMAPQKDITGIYEGKNFYGAAITEPVIPHIEILGPMDKSEIFIPVQTFSYRLKAVDYEATCSLIIEGETMATTKVTPGTRVEEKTKLGVGYYDWKVQCQIANGRTISSKENSLAVESYKELDTSFKITGNVVEEQPNPVKRQASFLIVLMGIAGLVFALKPSN